jgi:hypothetical protein
METNKLNIANKLKEDIKLIFQQLKSGCYRIKCYNPYCPKGNGIYKITQTYPN